MDIPSRGNKMWKSSKVRLDVINSLNWFFKKSEVAKACSTQLRKSQEDIKKLEVDRSGLACVKELEFYKCSRKPLE